MASRDEMRRIAAESIAQGDATGWFERFYRQAGGDWDQVPWADRRPNPYLVAWLPIEALEPAGRVALRDRLGRDAAHLVARCHGQLSPR